MDIKDYIHLYMGATFWTDNSQGEVNAETLKHIRQMVDKGKNVQLHLRRLEDMTEEEKQVIGSMSKIFMNHKAYSLPSSELSKRWAADQTRYLLKQGFDIFGLIDAGLAIDAKTIKEG